MYFTGNILCFTGKIHCGWNPPNLTARANSDARQHPGARLGFRKNAAERSTSASDHGVNPVRSLEMADPAFHHRRQAFDKINRIEQCRHQNACSGFPRCEPAPPRPAPNVPHPPFPAPLASQTWQSHPDIPEHRRRTAEPKSVGFLDLERAETVPESTQAV
jgi:hypothetical protein